MRVLASKKSVPGVRVLASGVDGRRPKHVGVF